MDIYKNASGHFSNRGNGQFGNVVRTGWKKATLSSQKTAIVAKYLANNDVDKVYKRGRSIYAAYLNGVEEKIL